MKQLMKFWKELVFISVVYLAGLIGINFINTALFLKLSFVSLVIPLFIIVYRLEIGYKSYVLLLVVFLISFFAEWIGVNTGLLFGDYVYGESLGIKIGGVPLLIGVNWVLLCLVSREIVVHFSSNKLVIVFSSSALMLGIDFLIEPVAPLLDFWSWNNAVIPLSNYRDWFVVALINQAVLLFIKPKKQIFALCLGYFIILSLFFLSFH